MDSRVACFFLISLECVIGGRLAATLLPFREARKYLTALSRTSANSQDLLGSVPHGIGRAYFASRNTTAKLLLSSRVLWCRTISRFSWGDCTDRITLALRERASWDLTTRCTGGCIEGKRYPCLLAFHHNPLYYRPRVPPRAFASAGQLTDTC